MQTYSTGETKLVKRHVKQGRKPSGLGKPFLQRLSEDDEKIMNEIEKKLGFYYNKNDFVRTAVKFYINNVYTELLNT